MAANLEGITPLTPEQEALVTKGLHVAKLAAHRRYRTAPHALEESDLLSLAYFGLVQAAKRWKPYCEERREKGLPGDETRIDWFCVFASRRCDGAIMDELRSRDYATRSLRAKSKRLQKAGQDEGVTISALAEITGMKVAEVSKVINDMQNRPVSLEADGSDFEVAQTTESQANVHNILHATAQAIRELPDEEQVVLALHYFAMRERADGKKMVNIQLQQIAAKLGVPEGYVSQLHTRAVRRVHDAMKLAAEGLL
jgi:RNA polymerase sigma factor for flagellar operon FliA